jgi:hypothetical protein
MPKPPFTLPGQKAPHAATASPRAGVPAVATKAMSKVGVLKRKTKPGGNPAGGPGINMPISIGKV